MSKTITLINSVKIIDNKYVIKKKHPNIKSTYTYLQGRDFKYLPDIIKEDDEYIYYKYIEDISYPKEQRMQDLMLLLSILHNKTAYYKEVDTEYYKHIYEDINNDITDKYKYYDLLISNINSEVYLSPASYLIARNVTLIYKSLDYAQKKIEAWLHEVDNKRDLRVVMIHNNLSLEHYIKNELPYLISLEHAKIDISVYDLVYLYRHYALEFDFIDLLPYYFSKAPFSKSEMLLFLSLIAIPDKIMALDSEYERVKSVRHLLDYLTKTSYILEKYRVEKETEKSQK